MGCPPAGLGVRREGSDKLRQVGSLLGYLSAEEIFFFCVRVGLLSCYSEVLPKSPPVPLRVTLRGHAVFVDSSLRFFAHFQSSITPKVKGHDQQRDPFMRELLTLLQVVCQLPCLSCIHPPPSRRQGRSEASRSCFFS